MPTDTQIPGRAHLEPTPLRTPARDERPAGQLEERS